MSFDFSHLTKGLEVSADRTTRYTLYHLAGEPVLILAPATEANKPYFNAVLRRMRRSTRILAAGAINPQMIAENRNEDRALFPHHVVRDWEGVLDREGKEVPFSPDACRAFLEALPDWVFDDLRNFAANAANFAEQLDVEQTGKN